MEAVIFVGLQGAGKSTFYRERFFDTHLRISLDLLRTRHRERRLLQFCVETGLRFVVDNTNPTRAERAVYIRAARRPASGSSATTSAPVWRTAWGGTETACRAAGAAEGSSGRRAGWKPCEEGFESCTTLD